jgi:hypothetical protein
MPAFTNTSRTDDMGATRTLPLSSLAVLILTTAAAAQTASVIKIADASSANDMSPDGRFIVGETDLDGNGFPDGTYLLDTVLNDMTILPPLGLNAVAVSDDGTVVLGDIPDPGGVGSNVAAIWTEATGWFSLGHLPDAQACPSLSDGYELSADGTVAVGLSWDGCDGRGFWWTAATGMLELEPLANGTNRASVVSADGSLIGGFAQGSFSRTPSIWYDTLEGVLMDPPDGDALGEIHGLRDDASMLLGTWSAQDSTPGAHKWTPDGSGGWHRDLIGQGSLLPGWEGIPMDVADNGTVVGFDILMTTRRAWIQPRGLGDLVLLETWIEDHGGSVPDTYTLEVCQAISADGTTIIGHGFLSGGWKVTIGWPCVGDLNDDDVVDVQDFLVLLANWNTDGPGADIAEPLNVVDVADFLGLLAAWGPC